MAEPHDAEGDGRGDRPDVANVLRQVSASAERRFERSRIIQSFDEHLAGVLADPRPHVRDAASYLLAAIEHFGHEEREVAGEHLLRYRIFDAPATGGVGRVYGHERAQATLVKRIKTFCDKGRIDRLLMLHGPNGSAKSTTIACLTHGLEAYSREPDGAIYRFNWIFSESLDRERLGFGEPHADRRTDTYAYLPPEDISARVVCEMRDNPLFLVPTEERRDLLRNAFAAAGLDPNAVPEHALEGELCQKCREVYTALLNSYQGDWSRVVQHVQVERFFLSKRYRVGATTIEPQRNIDAASRPINVENRHRLPPVLQNVPLYELVGDLVDANRGIVEYSDYFKRPLEVNKYLLTTIENNTISLSATMAFLDVVMLATANEKNLCLAKRSPDFTSFKGRFEFIGVPYLLEVSKEEPIYLEYLDSLGREKHVAPNTGRVVALWAVLTRLKRPRAKDYPGALGALVGRLTPLEKARLYDEGRPPDGASDPEKRELVAALPKIRAEFDDHEEEFEGLLDAAHEGRRGASPREVISLLADAAADADFPCLTPQAVLRALREFAKDVSVHDFLRLAPQAGYHDVPKLIDDCEAEYQRLAEDEVLAALDLVDADAYTRMFEDYFVHVRAWTRDERVRHPQTGELEPPDIMLMRRVEGAIQAEGSADAFRKNLVTRIAVWSIDHPGEKVEMREVFGDLFRALRDDFYAGQEEQIRTRLRHALRFGTEDLALLDPQQQQHVQETYARLEAMGYCERCARELLAYVLRARLG